MFKIVQCMAAIACLFVNVVTLWLLQIVAHFTASWCIPSVFMNTFFEELASSYKDALFLIVDVDEVKVKQLLSLSSLCAFVQAPFVKR